MEFVCRTDGEDRPFTLLPWRSLTGSSSSSTWTSLPGAFRISDDRVAVAFGAKM